MRLVLLHSLPLDGTMWENCLSIDCDEVIAPTLYGFGDSLEAWAVGILGLVGGDPFVVAGNSIGGSCALEVAKLAPDSVAGIVLIGAKAGHRREPEFRDEAIRRLSDGGMAEAWPAYWEPLFGEHADPEVVETARQIAFRQQVADVVRGTYAFHMRVDRSEFVRLWTKQIDVVAGDQDRPEGGLKMANSAPKGRFHLVRDAGHYATLEQPSATRLILEGALRDAEAGRRRAP